MSNQIVNAIIGKIKETLKNKVEAPKLTEQQAKIQKAYTDYNYGCHKEAVAVMIEAITGFKPAKADYEHSLFTVVKTISTNTTDMFAVVVSDQYAFSSKNSGYWVTTNMRAATDTEATAFLEEFAKVTDAQFLEWVTVKLGSTHLKTLMEAL